MNIVILNIATFGLPYSRPNFRTVKQRTEKLKTHKKKNQKNTETLATKADVAGVVTCSRVRLCSCVCLRSSENQR